jgi:O-antigen ligase
LDRKFVEILGRSWHVALPGAATAVLAFVAGGFFAVTTGLSVAVLCLVLVAHVTLAERPFAGWSVLLAVMATSLALFAAWVLLSGGWSDSPARALVEFDRALLYLLMLVFIGLHVRGRGRLSALLRWVALAIAATCAVALLTRLLPTTFPTRAGVNNERLAFPLTYWNAMGIFAGLGVVLATHFTASEREPAYVRVAAAVTLPVVAVTLYFTFSRGGIAAAIAGVVIYVVVAHPRGLAAALPAAGIPLAVALHQAYGAELLAQYDYAGADARAQGRTLLLVVIACMVAAGLLRWLGLRIDARLARRRIGARPRTIVFGGAGIAALLVLAVGLAGFELDDKLANEWHQFERGNRPPGNADLRTRLTEVGNNGRLDIWRVALKEAAGSPLHGGGAGTFRLAWERYRPPPPVHVVDGHSLYYETRAELGWVGIALLLVTFAVPLGVAISRLWGPGRHAHAAFLAAAAALLMHAMIDWDWEMPALFVWFFGAAGAVIAAPAEALERARVPRRLTRVVAGLAFLVLAVTPLMVAASGSRLNAAEAAFRKGDCVKATNSALDSLDALASQAAAFEILGWCNIRAGQPRLALAAMRNAQRRDPDNWQYAYGVAVAQTLLRQDPRPEALKARRLNPLDDHTRALWDTVNTRSPARRLAGLAKLTVPTD